MWYADFGVWQLSTDVNWTLLFTKVAMAYKETFRRLGRKNEAQILWSRAQRQMRIDRGPDIQQQGQCASLVAFKYL